MVAEIHQSWLDLLEDTDDHDDWLMIDNLTFVDLHRHGMYFIFCLDFFLNNIKKITQDLSRTLYCGIVSWCPALSCLCSSFIVRHKGGKTYKISCKSLLTLCTGDLSHVSQRDCSSRRCGQSSSGKCKQLLLYQAQRLFTSGGLSGAVLFGTEAEKMKRVRGNHQCDVADLSLAVC